MRKQTILLALAALIAANVGCTARCKNWFHKGSPCGTMVTGPAVLSAPIAMGAPMAGPVMAPNCCCEQQPVCVPCDPCMQYDPCGGGGQVSSGYFGGYLPAASSDCGCANGGATMAPTMTVTPGTIQPGGIPTYPGPGT